MKKYKIILRGMGIFATGIITFPKESPEPTLEQIENEVALFLNEKLLIKGVTPVSPSPAAPCDVELELAKSMNRCSRNLIDFSFAILKSLTCSSKVSEAI